jgi:hypothetical protein
VGKNLATEMAPPFVLVAHFFIAGAFFYALTSVMLPFFAGELDSFFLSSSIASLSHLYLLGFVMMIIFGAMYQLVPVILEIPLFSKDFAYVQFYIYIIGIALFTFSLYFEHYSALMPYGALLVYLSMLIFIANVFLTYLSIERWTIVAKYILVSNIFLLIGVSIGFFIALNLIYGFYDGDIVVLVQAHIAGVIGGYMLMTIMGVGMVLLPMFSLSHGFSEKAINIAFYMIIVSLALFIFASIYGFLNIEIISLIFIALSIIFALYQMWLIFSTRIRKQNDFWAKNMIAAFVSAIISLAILLIAVITNNDRMVMLFGFIVFFGFLVFFIVGHIYKILPFLVWYQRYSPLVGKIKVPMLNDMVKERVADIQFWITLTGTILAALSILLNIKSLFVVGSIIMAVSSSLIMYNIYYTLVYGLEELREYEEKTKREKK